MELKDKVIVVTGAGSGIGAAMIRRFAQERPAALVAVDLDDEHVRAVAASAAATPLQADVAKEADVARVVTAVEAQHGRIDLFCSNAGILVLGGADTPNEQWQRTFDVNVMAHVYAARALLPGMLARGGGYLLNTASAAGLLTQLGSATYSVTKHAALAFAEWLAITHRDQGLKVSLLCPQAVRTAMLGDFADGGVAGVDGVMEPSQVADIVVDGLRDERFLILPHPEVAEYFRRKATDYDRWLAGMARLQRRFMPS